MEKEMQRTTKPEHCSVTINIKASGNVNIYNCSKTSADKDCGCTVDKGHDDPPTDVTGACVPVTLGAKPKQSQKKKLDRLLKRRPLHSSLFSSFIHTAKRFEAGKTPANDLEKRFFEKFSKLSPGLRKLLKCTNRSFDALPSKYKKLFDQNLVRDIDTPVTIKTLSKSFAEEIGGIVNDQVLGNYETPLNERPGKVRLYEYGGGDDVYPNQVHVFKLNNLRTNDHVPYLALRDYLPEELQQVCTPTVNGETVTWDCRRQQSPCDGNSVDDVCLTVPIVQSGTSVTLAGVNFFDINAKIKYRLKNTIGSYSQVDAFVYGDLSTPVTETIGGTDRLIVDNRVTDKLFFTIPETTPSGIYEFYVEIPNSSGFSGPGFGDTLNSSSQYIEVVPPSTARFQVASENLWARRETAPQSWGSDEVGIRISALPILPNFRIGTEQTNDFNFGDVDSEETRTMEAVLFSHTQPIAGVILSVMGFEIDSDDAYKKQITEWTDVFYDLLKDQLDFLFDHRDETEDAIKWLADKGFWGYVAIGIAVLITFAVDLFVAIWAPADLIIQDTLSYSTADLTRITNFDIPAPTANSDRNLYTTAGDIHVRLMLNYKSAFEYVEERGYISDDEDSWYNIRFRYNRTV